MYNIDSASGAEVLSAKRSNRPAVDKLATVGLNTASRISIARAVLVAREVGRRPNALVAAT